MPGYHEALVRSNLSIGRSICQTLGTTEDLDFAVDPTIALILTFINMDFWGGHHYYLQIPNYLVSHWLLDFFWAKALPSFPLYNYATKTLCGFSSLI